jgi:hypothetical protein
MESKLKTLAKQYLWLIIIFGLLAVGMTTFWGYGKYLEHETDSQVSGNNAAANTAVQQAATSETQAANSSIERHTEDQIRTRTIVPKLDIARRNSASSQASLAKARQQFNAKTIPSNSSRADDCQRLSRLWPDTEFGYCTR